MNDLAVVVEDMCPRAGDPEVCLFVYLLSLKISLAVCEAKRGLGPCDPNLLRDCLFQLVARRVMQLLAPTAFQQGPGSVLLCWLLATWCCQLSCLESFV